MKRFTEVEIIKSQVKIIETKIGKYENVIQSLSQRLKECIYNDWNHADYVSLLLNFKILFQTENFKLPWKLFTLARSSHNKVCDDPMFSDFWMNLSLEHMRLSSDLIESLINKKISVKDAFEMFNQILESNYTDRSTKEILIECFSKIVNVLLNSQIPDEYLVHQRHVNILACSGSGWSGSGAVIDFLREFKNVHFIKGEAPFFEVGNYSFLSIINSYIKRENFVKNVISFFFLYIVGSINILNSSIYKSLFLRYNKFNATRSDSSLKECLLISTILSNLIYFYQNNQQDRIRENLINLGNEIVNLLSVDVPDSQIPLLDNCIHIQNFKVLEYITNLKMICVYRDPRSIFVAQCKENYGFDKDVKKFINGYKNIASVIDKLIDLKNNNSLNNIDLISFENFVKNENLRLDIIKKYNISVSSWSMKNKYFDSNVSICNVNNFLSFDDQCSIKNIENNCKIFSEKL